MSEATARAYWATGPGHGEIRAASLPVPSPGEVVVEALYSGVSRGTELLVAGGHVPASERARMRAPHQEGEFPFPVKYGYASVGRIVDGPTEALGCVVFCLHPHQSRYVVALDEAIVVPDGVPPARAVLAANLETAINAVWDGGVGPGDRVSVVGGGVIGLLVSFLVARIPGCELELIDLASERRGIATQLGARFVAAASARGDADVVFHASGQALGLATALGLGGVEATIVELSWYGDRLVPVPLGEAFHSRRLTLRSSQVGQLPPARRPRWPHRRRLALALALLEDPRLDALITSEGSLDELPEAMARLAGPGDHLCHRVRYGDAPAGRVAGKE